MTGRHHSREHITSLMALFPILKMIHGGIVHNDLKQQKLLLQNKYYVIPTVNVDGVAFMEDHYFKTGELLM